LRVAQKKRGRYTGRLKKMKAEANHENTKGEKPKARHTRVFVFRVFAIGAVEGSRDGWQRFMTASPV
jgi:hypothetical protein